MTNTTMSFEAFRVKHYLISKDISHEVYKYLYVPPGVIPTSGQYETALDYMKLGVDDCTNDRCKFLVSQCVLYGVPLPS